MDMVQVGNKVNYYTQMCYYEEYLENKINNESILASKIRSHIPINESSYKKVTAILEARLSDNIKSKWQKFIGFIKNLFAKFAESMTAFFTNNKEYLEKYKDIILRKKPKDIDYSYNGDYKIGIDRCINTPVPVYNGNYAEALEKDVDADTESSTLAIIMQGRNEFKNDSASSASDNFKEYFMGQDKGEHKGKFTDLNFTDLYNFCKNSDKINEIVRKDLKYLDDSTDAIRKAIEEKLNAKKNEQALQNNSSYVNEATPPDNDPPGDNPTTGGTGGNPTTGGTGGKSNDAGKSNLNISSDAVSQMGSMGDRKALDKETTDNFANAADGSGKELQKISSMITKWSTICRALISAKCTAVNQIAKDYMDIIRAHVRSYVGQSKNKEDNKSQDTATNYYKDKEDRKTPTPNKVPKISNTGEPGHSE